MEKTRSEMGKAAYPKRFGNFTAVDWGRWGTLETVDGERGERRIFRLFMVGGGGGGPNGKRQKPLAIPQCCCGPLLGRGPTFPGSANCRGAPHRNIVGVIEEFQKTGAIRLYEIQGGRSQPLYKRGGGGP